MWTSTRLSSSASPRWRAACCPRRRSIRPRRPAEQSIPRRPAPPRGQPVTLTVETAEPASRPVQRPSAASGTATQPTTPRWGGGHPAVVPQTWSAARRVSVCDAGGSAAWPGRPARHRPAGIVAADVVSGVALESVEQPCPEACRVALLDLLEEEVAELDSPVGVGAQPLLAPAPLVQQLVNGQSTEEVA